MIYIRGQRQDYENWEQKEGCEGWGWDDVLRCFKRAENNERGQDEYHGAGGPVNVADLRTPNPIAAAFIDAGVEAGFPRNNGFQRPGAGRRRAGIRSRRKTAGRYSAARAYIHANPHRQPARDM